MKNYASIFSLRTLKIFTNMQKKIFENLVQTALTVGLFWTILKLTPKSALLSFTILYLKPILNMTLAFLHTHPPTHPPIFIYILLCIKFIVNFFFCTRKEKRFFPWINLFKFLFTSAFGHPSLPTSLLT